jgi:hypothetical protein
MKEYLVLKLDFLSLGLGGFSWSLKVRHGGKDVIANRR